jgi:polysaccharide deacetylase family protein (PEP-CTERM system associated)
MKNIFTVDVEEYYHAENIFCSLSLDKIKSLPNRLEVGLNKMLDLLSNNDNKATFFVLGCIAEKNRHLLKRIVSEGHEIASHGYNHVPLYKHTPLTFDEDLNRSIKVLSDVTGQKILGYRATSFSLSNSMPWFFDVLRKYDIIYDSSKSVSFFRSSYYEGLKSHGYFEISQGIFEFPVSYLKAGPIRMPLGGGYFRAYPYWLTKLGIKQVINSKRHSFLFYIHPWELDFSQPRMKVPFMNYLRHYTNLKDTEMRLKMLLNEMKFVSIRDFLNIKSM